VFISIDILSDSQNFIILFTVKFPALHFVFCK